MKKINLILTILFLIIYKGYCQEKDYFFAFRINTQEPLTCEGCDYFYKNEGFFKVLTSGDFDFYRKTIRLKNSLTDMRVEIYAKKKFNIYIYDFPLQKGEYYLGMGKWIPDSNSILDLSERTDYAKVLRSQYFIMNTEQKGAVLMKKK